MSGKIRRQRTEENTEIALCQSIKYRGEKNAGDRLAGTQKIRQTDLICDLDHKRVVSISPIVSLLHRSFLDLSDFYFFIGFCVTIGLP